MSDPKVHLSMEKVIMDSDDEAQSSDLAQHNKFIRSSTRHHYQKHRHSGNSEKENYYPTSENVQRTNIFSFMRQGSGKVVLSKRMSLPSDIDLESESCDCHCPACCGCQTEVQRQSCSSHQSICKKLSDSVDSQTCGVEWSNLPSPTAINSWGHFCKSRHNYKYRRSDYSSESDEETPIKNRNCETAMLEKQKSHLPSITLTRTGSLSSNGSFEKTVTSYGDQVERDGVKPMDFKDRMKVSKS